MCGICGWLSLDGSPVDRAVVQRMTALLFHRGPDDEGFHFDDGIGLGIRRLSIIDLETGHQPIHNEDQTIWIVLNGEVYNFPELRRELETKGHQFYTHSDTEVIVHAYEEWGADCVLRLNGIFGFAIWDQRQQRLLLARDHFGVKPLYYYYDSERLVFASELKAIMLHPSVSRSIDLEGLNQALTYGFISSPYTLFQGIHKLGPGHRLVVEKGNVQVERYWHPVPKMIQEWSEHDLVLELRRRLEAAVRRQMISDVPIGALLSGGVDSTAVVTLMSRYSEKVRTFSIGIRDAPEINELAAARAVARRLGTEHAEIEIGAQEYMDFLPTAHWYLEEPCTPSALLTYFVSKLAQGSVKVVLTGQGADELFGGYARYLGEIYGKLYRQLPGVVTHSLVPGALALLPGRLRWKRAAYALIEADPLRRFTRIYEVFSPQERSQLFRPEVFDHLMSSNSDVRFDPIQRWAEGLDELDSLDQLLYIDARLMLADNLLIFGDKMAMAASIEARVPMLDLELMEFVESIPARLKLKGRRPKYLLKRALAEWLPAEVLNRRKLGFQVPESQWFRGSMWDFTRELLLNPDSVSTTYLRPKAVERLLQVHQSGRQNLWRQIFNLVSVELLYQVFVKNLDHSMAFSPTN